MRKLMVCVLVFQLFIFTGILFGKAASSSSWLEAEIKYFQEKEYVGDKKLYSIYSIDFYPPYIKGEEIKEEYGIINEEDLKDIILTGKASKEEILHYLRLLRNEIYARRGYIFRSENLREFFEKMDWYTPEVTEVELNGDERYNIKKLKKYEKIVGSTKPEKELYTKEVIIEAKWGNGPGEFALEPLDETYTWKTYLAIDQKSNIYIADPKGKKIHIFNPNGKLIKTANIPKERIPTVEGIGTVGESNILIITTSFKNDTRIIEIDEKGKVVDEYIIKGIWIDQPSFLRSQDGEVYLWASWFRDFSTSGHLGEAYFSLSKIKKLEKSELLIDIKNSSLGVFKVVNKREKIFNFDLKEMFGNEWLIHTECTPRVFKVIENKEKEYIIYEDWLGNIKMESRGKILFNEDVRKLNDWSFQHHRLGIITVWAEPLFDNSGNFYLIIGDFAGLKVIKYIPSKDIWK